MKRNLQFITNKQGVIDAEKALYKAIGLDDQTIEERVKHLEDTLEDGGYYYDGLSFNKLGSNE